MILKKKKIRVWCSKRPTPVDLPGTGYMGYELRGRRLIPKKGRWSKDRFTIPSLVKCPTCGKRFKPKVRDCGDDGCWHVSGPAHKREI